MMILRIFKRLLSYQHPPDIIKYEKYGRYYNNHKDNSSTNTKCKK